MTKFFVKKPYFVLVTVIIVLVVGIEFAEFARGLWNTEYHGDACRYDGDDVCQCQL